MLKHGGASDQGFFSSSDYDPKLRRLIPKYFKRDKSQQ